MSLIAVESIWEYQTAANTVPADPSAVTVPSSGYSYGTAPFGTLGALVTDKPINTAWALNTGLWLRRNVAVSGLAPILLTGRIENAVFVYFDGVYVGTVNPSNGNRQETPVWRVVISKAMATEGVHEIALFCLDEPGSTSGDTSYVYMEADYLPAMLTLQPQAPAKESLAWKTDVMESMNGSEDRLQVRLSPRQQFQLSYPANAKETARAFNTIYGERGEQWIVPVWSQAQHLGSVAAGLTTLTAATTFEFRASSLAILWQSTDRWQVVGVDLVGSGNITLSSLTEAFDNAWLMPVRFAHMASNPQKKLNGYEAEWQITFDVDDNASLTVADPTQYLGDDIYFDVSLLSGDSLTDDVVARIDKHDEELGVVTYIDPWLHNRVGRTHRVLAANAAEAWTMRQWLHRRAGKYKQFWQPSFEVDLRLLSTGTIVSNIIVSQDEYERFASTRTHLAIQAGSAWYARAITGITKLDENRIQLTLDSALNIAASSVLRVCYLGLKRLDTDRVEISWIGGGVAQTEFRIVELSP